MMRTTKRSLALILLSAAACGSAGCELIPGLLSGPAAPLPEEPAPLAVTLEAVEGTIGGAPLDPSTLEVSGSREGRRLDFHVRSTRDGRSIEIVVPGGEGVHQNPYSGSGLPGETLPEAGLPIDAGPGRGGESPGRIAACGQSSDCRTADEFLFQSAQTGDGRSVVAEGMWDDGDRVHLELRYRAL